MLSRVNAIFQCMVIRSWKLIVEFLLLCYATVNIKVTQLWPLVNIANSVPECHCAIVPLCQCARVPECQCRPVKKFLSTASVQRWLRGPFTTRGTIFVNCSTNRLFPVIFILSIIISYWNKKLTLKTLKHEVTILQFVKSCHVDMCYKIWLKSG